MSATIIVCTANTYTLELPRALFVNFYGSNFHKNGRLEGHFPEVVYDCWHTVLTVQ